MFDRRVLSPVMLALLASCCSYTAAAQFSELRPSPAVVSITVGPAAANPERVPSSLFGSFLEPIGNSINQGLSAEILINGSLEDGLWSYVNVQKMVDEQPEIGISSNQTGLPYPWLPLSRKLGSSL